MRSVKYIISLLLLLVLVYCGSDKPKEENEESPTAGRLRIFYNEGLTLHVKNQVYTFEGFYGKAKITATPSSEAEAVKALLDDSCTGIIITRLLNENEKKAFQQKDLYPKHSVLARTGVALIVNQSSSLRKLTREQIIELLSDKLSVTDSLNNKSEPIAVFDNKNSAITRYLIDSLLQGKSFGPKCSATNNSLELLKTVSENKDAIGFIDFAWLSDKDDSLYKFYEGKIRFLAVGIGNGTYVEPNQSSFKTNEYPFTRTVYYLRRSGDFTLSKGLEAFMAGPKGQMIFLKQGLLPNRQQERIIQVNTGPITEEK